MRTGLLGIIVGISTAVSFENEYKLQSSVITLSLLSEIVFIVISGLIELLYL